MFMRQYCILGYRPIKMGVNGIIYIQSWSTACAAGLLSMFSPSTAYVPNGFGARIIGYQVVFHINQP